MWRRHHKLTFLLCHFLTHDINHIIFQSVREQPLRRGCAITRRNAIEVYCLLRLGIPFFTLVCCATSILLFFSCHLSLVFDAPNSDTFIVLILELWVIYSTEFNFSQQTQVKWTFKKIRLSILLSLLLVVILLLFLLLLHLRANFQSYCKLILLCVFLST